MEEYEELLKSMQLWIETTNHLLTVEAENDSAKALSKHANALQVSVYTKFLFREPKLQKLCSLF